MNEFENFFHAIGKDIEGFFNNPEVVKVEKQLAAIIPFAMNIVAQLGVGTNPILTTINAVATKWVVPELNELSVDPTLAGNSLLNMASAIVQKNVPPADWSLIQTAVQTAVTLVKSGVKVPPTSITPPAKVAA